MMVGQNDSTTLKFDISVRYSFELWDGMNAKNFGDEADIFIRYQYNKHWQFTGAFGYFKPGDLEQINFKDPEDAVWFAFQILFSLN